MFKYGKLLLKGEKIQKNEEEGFNYIKMAANKDYPKALYYYSELLSLNEELSFQYLKKAAYKGHNLAMIKYGKKIIHSNPKESSIFFKKASDDGNINAMKLYTLMFSLNYLTLDSKIAAHYSKILADNGDIDSMYEYASKLINGQGVDVNKFDAAQYFKRAADEGNICAMHTYGLMLVEGDVIPKNDEEAIKYFKMGVDNDDPKAMASYGYMLENGIGTTINKKEAIKYYKMAIEKNNNVAAMIN